MTWRKFATFVRGLSPNSATVASLQSEQYMGAKEKVNVVETPEAAERQFNALFAPVKRRKPTAKPKE